MQFSSLTFIYIFLPAFMLIYYIVPKAWRNAVLFISSLAFLGWGEPLCALAILTSTAVDYFLALNMQNQKIKKVLLILSIFLNIGTLIIFREAIYLKSINAFDMSIGLQSLKIFIPIGVSVYTLKSLSYTIDVYKQKIIAEKDFFTYACFVTMFPQLPFGPIMSYKEMVLELKKRNYNINIFIKGLGYFIRGLFKKVMLANNIGLLWNTINQIPTNQLSPLSAWLGIIAFTLQIYFELSGISDMATGIGKMLGFNFIKNFNYPLTALSVREYSKRFNISLNNWFKKYVYNPLGGSKNGIGITAINVLVISILTALWYGTSYNFILFGLFFFLVIVFEKTIFQKLLEKLPNAIKHIYVVFVVLFSMVLFVMPTLPQAFSYYSSMFGLNDAEFLSNDVLKLLFSYSINLVFCILGCTKFVKIVSQTKLFDRNRTYKQVLSISFYAVLLILCTAYLL